ncbi:MAG: FG-GAP-like repeat-containing protein [Acidimicrobiales bacterium]
MRLFAALGLVASTLVYLAPSSSAAPGDDDDDGIATIYEDANIDGDGNPATNPGPDTDGDGLANYLDADDDGDSIPTALESADPNGDGNPTDARDSDHDAQPNYLDRPTIASTGYVGGEQKISATAGGLVGPLESLDNFAMSVASIGDLDGDGTTDLAVGAGQDDDGGVDAGAVYVLFMNPDGSVRTEQKISATSGGLVGPLDNNDIFGTSVAGVGDINGDGINDLAVGAYLDDDGAANAGAVYLLFLNRDGTVGGEQKISATNGGLTLPLPGGTAFGNSVAGIGDLNGDGFRDIVVGASTVGTGEIYVLLLDGSGFVIQEQLIRGGVGGFVGPLDANDRFGISVGAVGDLDQNGTTDIVVGADRDDDGAGDTGAVYILFLNPDGTVGSEQKISATAGGMLTPPAPADTFGYSAAGIGDMNGDGVSDIIVGAFYDDDGGGSSGAAYLLYLRDDGTVQGQQKLSATAGGVRGPIDPIDFFGFSAAGLGDINGDGTIDVAVGAVLDDDGFSNVGAVYILKTDAAQSTVVAVPDTIATSEDVAISFDPALNDTDSDGDAIVVVDASEPANGVVTRRVDGSLLYLPSPSFQGVDAFESWTSDAGSSLAHYWGMNADGVDSIGGADATIAGTTDVPGEFGRARAFDEAGDYLEIPDVSYANNLTVSFEFTIDENAGIILAVSVQPR